jgi:hypothetical protein
MHPSMQIHLLWHSPNGPMVVFPSITVFLAILEHYANGRGISNGHISSSWRIPILHGFAIPTRFKFCRYASCEVFSGTSGSFSNLDFFLLSFLAFFPVIQLSGFLFPFLFLSSLSMVTSHC